jgi:hypothetical protein
MDFIAYRKMASRCPISMSMLDLDVPAHPGKKVSITFAKLLGKVALFRQHRDEMHRHEGGRGEQRNPKIVHRKAKSDHKERNSHIHRGLRVKRYGPCKISSGVGFQGIGL